MPEIYDPRPNEVEQRLREIDERVSKATAPPWSDDKGILWIPSFCGMLEAGVGVPRGADATFCAHAREDVPWLLSLLREREEEIKTLSALFDESQEENKRLRHLLDEIERGTDDIREGLHGCGDNSCIVKRPMGMATNGGCRCVARNWFEGQVIIGRAVRKAQRLEEENRKLREALLMCKRRVQRLDELGVTRSDNWLAAIDAALRGEHS